MTESLDQSLVATESADSGVTDHDVTDIGGAGAGIGDDDAAGAAHDGVAAGAHAADAADTAGATAADDADADTAADADTVSNSDVAETDDGDDQHDELVAEGDAAGDYLERLLDILDYDGDIDLDVEGDRAVVSIVGDGDIDTLVGDHGQVLNALQELTRLAAGIETGVRSRLMLDIAGYRARRRAELTELGRETAEKVVVSGESVTLGVMNPFERKVVHDAVATVSGATSSSVGQEPRRRVVVSVAD